MSAKPPLHLYRDCLRLIGHLSPGTTSTKSQSLRSLLRAEFNKNRGAQGEEAERLRGGAVRGLANYLTMVSAKSGGGANSAVGKNLEEFERRSVTEMKTNKPE